MELSFLVLLVLAIFYIPIYFWVRISPNAAKYGLVKYGPLIMIKTRLGTRLMDRWSVYKRFWNFFGALSIVLSIILMITILYILAVGVGNLVHNLSAPGIGIEYALAIPGFNPLLPIWYGILGLVVAMVIHELAHGLQTRANGMRVDSTGLLYGVVPLGAFVEPNEEDIAKSSRKVKLHLYSAGISVNFIAAIATFGIFAVLMLGSVSSVYGGSTAIYSISDDSAAYGSGIPSGAIIETIEGEEYFYDDADATYSWNPGDVVTVTYVTESGHGSVDMRWGLYVETVTPNSPADGKLESKSYVLSLTDGGSETKMYSSNQFKTFMGSTSPGDVITVKYMSDDGSVTDTVEVKLSSKGSVGFLGIGTTTSGMNFTTPDIMLDIARNPLRGADSISEGATSIMSYIAGPFNGFSPMPESVHWWYDVPLGDAFWIIVSALYWIFWLNIMLGISNAIPAYPFDGGFIFLNGINSVFERFGMKDAEKRDRLSQKVTSYVSIVTLMFYLIVIIAIVF